MKKRERKTERQREKDTHTHTEVVVVGKGKAHNKIKTTKCFNCIGSYKEPTLCKQITKKFRAKVGRFYYRG